MPSRYTKIRKHVVKKKGASKVNSLHENSRDALRLRKAITRDDKVARLNRLRKGENEAFLSRIDHFQSTLPEPERPLTDEEIHAAITEYLARNDEELAELKAERRVGRPASTKQETLERAREVEAREYETGYWMPDMKSEVNVAKLAIWKGQWSGLGQLTFVRVEKNGTIKESAFPPKGAA